YAWRISHVYNEYTLFYLAENDIDKALEYALKCNEATSLYRPVINVCINKVLLAKIYLRLNDYETAMRYAGEAMEQANILKSDNLHVEVFNVMSDIYLATGQYPEAEAEAFKTWRVDSTNISESRTAVANIALSNIYMQNTDKAALFFNKYIELNNLYSEKSFHITVSDLSIKYEIEKKEIRIQSMKRQRLLFLIISITGIVLSIVGWAVSLQKIRRMRMERQLIAVRSILEGEHKERERVARDLHDGLNGMISSVKIRLASMKYMQHISEKLDKCIDEIHCIISDMNPSSLNRFGMKAALEDYCCRFPNVQFHFFGDDRRIDEKLELAVYACTYELVNNSIRHSGATVINVQLVQESTRVSLTVQDNGCGFDKKLVGEGSGLRNVNYRIIAFGGAINIVTSPGNGAETNIEFKIKNTLR
ncbi:MAG: histidine kinase, partial [Tannerella sp.]|nr:histidine kinase [Tannerella sp.]